MSGFEKPTSRVTIAIAWIIVLIPLGWGVYESVVKSLPLLHFTALEQPSGPSEIKSGPPMETTGQSK